MSKFPDPTKNYTAEPVKSTPIPPPTTPYQPPKPQPSVPSTPTSSTSTPPTSTSPIIPPSPSQTPKSAPPPSFSIRKFLPILLGISALILIWLAFTLIPKLFKSSSKQVTLTYWGLWEPASVMQTVIADYERDHPHIKINYQMQSPKGYRTRLQSAISSGNGPDIARIHNTWLPMFFKFLTPVPQGTINSNDYYPIITSNLVHQGKLYAVPLEIDGLALFYNQDILVEAGAEPPTDWNTFRKLAFDLTRRSPNTGIVERAGTALGTTNNIPHWSDILGLLILQNSGNPLKPTSQAVQDALTFYTIFSTTDHTWDSSQPDSIHAFATGTVAMILAPAWQIAEIQAINPTLNFGIAPVPQLSDQALSWATYWVEVVPINSQHQQEAWDFLAYLGSDQTLQKLYSTQTQIRSLGELYPKPNLAPLIQTDPLASAFIEQAPYFKSWYLADRTHDEGINDEFIKYYEDAINTINSGSSVSSIIDTLQAGVTQVANKYHLQ